MNSISKLTKYCTIWGHYGISNKYGDIKRGVFNLILPVKSALILDTANNMAQVKLYLVKQSSNFKIVSKFLHEPSQSVSTHYFQFKKLNRSSVYGYMAHRPMDIVHNPKLWDELNFHRMGRFKIDFLSMKYPKLKKF